MSHRRKMKDANMVMKKVGCKIKDVEIIDFNGIPVPHVTIDITDLLIQSGNVPIPEAVRKANPSVGLTFEGSYGFSTELKLVNIFNDVEGDTYYTFERGSVSVTVHRSDMKVLLDNTN